MEKKKIKDEGECLKKKVKRTREKEKKIGKRKERE